MLELHKLEVVEKTMIKKYAEGVTPEDGQPFEIVENSKTLKGQEALDYLRSMGMSDEDILQVGGACNNAVNTSR